jgi:hypothetical protein
MREIFLSWVKSSFASEMDAVFFQAESDPEEIQYKTNRGG